MNSNTKLCGKCQEKKEFSNFSKCQRNKDGYQNYCKFCISNYQIKNRKKLNQYDKEYKLKRKEKIINHYGGKCACCEETKLDFLVLDHINGGGTQHRKEIGIGGSKMYCWILKNNYPKIFRVLCHNCNWSMFLNKGKCCHNLC